MSLGWGGCVVVMGAIASDQVIVLVGAFAGGLGVALTLGLRVVRSEALLARTRLELEQAMLAAERARIARDMHDILGHSLTAIAVKADLTERLLKVDVGRAAVEVGDIRDVSRQALADLRATTSGLREVSLGGEIAAARAVMVAVGIELRAPARLGPLPDEDATVLGYVVREAVTNVARHADATWCSIEVTGVGVTIRDNGRGLGERAAGSGLTGLAERVNAAGGTLSVTEREGGGVVVLARLGTVAEPEAAAVRDACDRLGKTHPAERPTHLTASRSA